MSEPAIELYDDPNRFARAPKLELGPRLRFFGYQNFILSRSVVAIAPDDRSLREKYRLVRPFFEPDWIAERTILDLGANSAFFCFKGLAHGAAQAVAVDLDPTYIGMLEQAKSHLGVEGLRIVQRNVTDVHEPADLVFAFALIHWIFSCTAGYGSLDKAIQKLSELTNEVLIVEWIEPDDQAIEFFHHLDFNQTCITAPYSREHFEQALRTHFDHFTVLGKVTPTRVVYAAFRHSASMPVLLDKGGIEALSADPQPHVWLSLSPDVSLLLAEDPAHFHRLCDRAETVLEQGRLQYRLGGSLVEIPEPGFFPDDLMRRFFSQRVFDGTRWLLPLNLRFDALLYHLLFHQGAMTPAACDRLRELARQAEIACEPERLNSFQNAFALFEARGIPLANHPEPPMPFIEHPRQVLSSRILAHCEGRDFTSRVYRMKGPEGWFIRKQAADDLAEREYRLLSRLEGPYFPRVFGFSRQDGYSTCDMEFIEGTLLSDLETFVLSWDDSTMRSFLHHGLSLLQALQEKGVMHRDIRLENLLVRDGRPVLIDFGWACAEDCPHITPEGLGAEGRPPESRYSDLYSMGVVFERLAFFFPSWLHLARAMTRFDSEARETDFGRLHRMVDEESPYPELTGRGMARLSAYHAERGNIRRAREALEKAGECASPELLEALSRMTI